MALAMLSWIVAIPLLGALTGLRSMVPIALVCLFAWRGHLDVDDTWAGWSAKFISVVIFSVLAAGELIGDKLPFSPARTAAFPLSARTIFGSLVGAICATSLQGSIIEGALLGGASAIAGTFLGYHIRYHLTKIQGFKDFYVALVEDALALGFSVLALGVITG